MYCTKSMAAAPALPDVRCLHGQWNISAYGDCHEPTSACFSVLLARLTQIYNKVVLF